MQATTGRPSARENECHSEDSGKHNCKHLWAERFPAEHGRAVALVEQHCTTYPVVKWIKLRKATKTHTKGDVVQKILEMLPKHCRERACASTKCPAKTLFENECTRLHREMGQPLIHRSSLAPAGSQRVDHNARRQDNATLFRQKL